MHTQREDAMSWSKRGVGGGGSQEGGGKEEQGARQNNAVNCKKKTKGLN